MIAQKGLASNRLRAFYDLGASPRFWQARATSVEVLELCLQIALGIAFPALVIRKDVLRLSAVMLARAWNDASLWCAVVTFGPLSLLVHFTRTRRSLWGLLLGVGWATADVLATLLLSLALQTVSGG